MNKKSRKVLSHFGSLAVLCLLVVLALGSSDSGSSGSSSKKVINLQVRSLPPCGLSLADSRSPVGGTVVNRQPWLRRRDHEAAPSGVPGGSKQRRGTPRPRVASRTSNATRDADTPVRNYSRAYTLLSKLTPGRDTLSALTAGARTLLSATRSRSAGQECPRSGEGQLTS